MFASSFRAVLVALVAVAQTPATPLPTPDESGTLGIIRPPHGWTQRAVADFPEVHVTNSFYNANVPSQRILLGHIDVTEGRSLASIVTAITTHLGKEAAVNIVSSAPARLCNGAVAGWMIRYTEPEWGVVEALLVGRDNGAAAIYVRERGTSEDPEALSAISSLCLVPFPK